MPACPPTACPAPVARAPDEPPSPRATAAGGAGRSPGAVLWRLVRALAGPAALIACLTPAAAQMRRADAPPREVGVVAAQLSEVPQVVTLPGRAVAYETAAVRPQVGGLIEAITYRTGQHVEAGTPMFRIEASSLDSALAAAEAAEAGAIAAQKGAAATVARYRALEGKGVSSAEVEAAEVALSQADAQLSAARAALQTARLERERATILAPIEGEAGAPAVTIGAIVTGNQSEPLATITRIDPVYVDVAASSARVLEARQRIAEGLMTPMDPPGIALVLENGRPYAAPGEIVASGSTVSTSTGTIDLRLQFPNAEGLILPGQFLRVDLTLGTIRAVLVPQRATTRTADGSLGVFVVRDGRAQRAVLTEAGVWNNAWAVTEGVAPGDRLIVDGLSNLRDGEAVVPVPVTLDENGVVVDEGAGPAASAGPMAAALSDAGEATGTPHDGGLWERLRPWLGLRHDETVADAAARRWQRLRGLLGLASAGA